MEPVSAAYDPAGHVEQALAPADEYVPAAHTEHAADDPDDGW